MPEIWDSTRLNDLAACLERYRLLRVEGWQPRPRDDIPDPSGSIHTEFGSRLHAMTEGWDRFSANGFTPEEASFNTLWNAEIASWSEGGKPWGGDVLPLWRCTGFTRHAKKRTFACDGARDWSVGEPTECPLCARPTERRTTYYPLHRRKNLISLVRAIPAYEEHRAETGYKVWRDAAGELGLERSLSAPLPRMDDATLVGTLDRISVDSAGDLWVHERKTTSLNPTEAWWRSFEMRPQIGYYIWLARRNGIPVQGAIVECCHVTSETVEFATRAFTRSEASLHELIDETVLRIWDYLTETAFNLAPTHNRSACDHADGGMPCRYRRVCSADPLGRADILAAYYNQEPIWNPLEPK